MDPITVDAPVKSPSAPAGPVRSAAATLPAIPTPPKADAAAKDTTPAAVPAPRPPAPAAGGWATFLAGLGLPATKRRTAITAAAALSLGAGVGVVWLTTSGKSEPTAETKKSEGEAPKHSAAEHTKPTPPAVAENLAPYQTSVPVHAGNGNGAGVCDKPALPPVVPVFGPDVLAVRPELAVSPDELVRRAAELGPGPRSLMPVVRELGFEFKLLDLAAAMQWRTGFLLPTPPRLLTQLPSSPLAPELPTLPAAPPLPLPTVSGNPKLPPEPVVVPAGFDKPTKKPLVPVLPAGPATAELPPAPPLPPPEVVALPGPPTIVPEMGTSAAAATPTVPAGPGLAQPIPPAPGGIPPAVPQLPVAGPTPLPVPSSLTTLPPPMPVPAGTASDVPATKVTPPDMTPPAPMAKMPAVTPTASAPPEMGLGPIGMAPKAEATAIPPKAEVVTTPPPVSAATTTPPAPPPAASVVPPVVAPPAVGGTAGTPPLPTTPVTAGPVVGTPITPLVTPAPSVAPVGVTQPSLEPTPPSALPSVPLSPVPPSGTTPLPMNPAVVPQEPVGSLPAAPAMPLPGNVVPSGGTRIEFSKPAGDPKPARVAESAPQTSFDVDVYEPQANDSYASIARHFYNDTRYASALAEYNRRKPLQNSGPVEAPPIHVLKKRYPQLVGAGPAAGATPPGEWGPPGGGSADPAPTFRAGGAKRYVVPPGGMTMRAVARLTLGTENRWQEIYDLNPQYVPNQLAGGTELKLPADAVVPR